MIDNITEPTAKTTLRIFAEKIKEFTKSDEMYKFEANPLDEKNETENRVLTIHGMMAFDHAKLVWTALVEIWGAENVPSEVEWYKVYCELGERP